MIDAEIRGQLLTSFHKQRHNAGGWVPTSDMILAPEPVDRQAIGVVCQHLADAGLIHWKALNGGSEGFVVGMAQITGLGVDVVEGHQPPPITIDFDRDRARDVNAVPAAIQIIPTLYPDQPDGVITVQNHIIVDTDTADFHAFMAEMQALTKQLLLSNEIAGETREKLLAEFTAGLAILKSPKPDPKIIDLLLKRPLVFIGEKSAGVAVAALATGALALLGKATGYW